MVRRKDQDSDGGITRVTIRMPTDIHEALLSRREEAGQSLNDLLIEAAAKLLGVAVPEIPKGIPGRKPRKGAREQKRKRSSEG